MAAAHVSGALPGYARLVLRRGQRMHERMHAWLAPGGHLHNLTRAVGCLAGACSAKARGATIRGRLIAVAAQARRGRSPRWSRRSARALAGVRR
jgi:hypothetical protein